MHILNSVRNQRWVLIVVLLTAACKSQAGARLTSLHSFAVTTNGYGPAGSVVASSDGRLYGTTGSGGTNGGFGTLFTFTPGGTLTGLYSFGGANDGAYPQGLIQGGDGFLYGTTAYGGTNGQGVVFRLSTNGMVAVLHVFSGGDDGANPGPSLVQDSVGNLYGTTYQGGPYTNGGTVFQIGMTGAFTNLYSFTGLSDGLHPSSLVQGSDGNLYGTTSGGGTSGYGTVFQLSANGLFASLYSFNAAGDGSSPNSLMQASDGFLYGTTDASGTDYGEIFQVSTNGTELTLYSFTGSDGRWPQSLIEGGDGYLYGVTYGGGTNGSGTIFQISTGGAFTSVYSFSGGADGSNPQPLRQGFNGNLYGTTARANPPGGTIFQVDSGFNLTTLHHFNMSTDGALPQAELVVGRDGNLYGTTWLGGIYQNETPQGWGTIFRISTNGAMTLLHSFKGVYPSDEAHPQTALVQASDGYFYGVTAGGYGTLFRISANGAFSSWYGFFPYGAVPHSSLLQAKDGSFYGTTSYDPDAGGFSSIFRFAGTAAPTKWYSFQASDVNPGSLIQGVDGEFYGTTYAGGFYTNQFGQGFGSVFKIGASGALTSLYSFTGANDGANPSAALLQADDGYLYGTTANAGIYTEQSSIGRGTVFRIDTNGVLTTLYSFTGGADGATPQCALIQDHHGNLFGTTTGGGAYRNGTVFQLNTNGAFTSLYSFTGGSDGATPLAGLVQTPDGNLYGTTSRGGQGGAGTVFQLSLSAAPPVQLTAVQTGNNLVLTWPASATGFVLQSATTLTNGGDWQASNVTSTQINGLNRVIFTCSNSAGYFRLRGP